MKTPSKNQILTKKQTAAVFGISYRTLERWYKRGYIRCIRVGNRVYYPYSEIYRIRDQFIDDKANGNYLEPYFNNLNDIKYHMDSGRGMI